MRVDNPRMPDRRGWSRDELLIALRLYMRSPFGKLHGRNPEIMALAHRIGRTPNALAMKACNFANLDPAFRATNRRGLSGASEADRAMWAEFGGSAEVIAAEAEDAVARLAPALAGENDPGLQLPHGETDLLRTVRARRVQSFFRAAVLTSYENRCAISGIAVRDLLVASHIIPWSQSVERRADPTNGLCLNALFDRAFDRGLITIDEGHRVVVARQLADAAERADLACSIREAHGRRIRMPHRLRPDEQALARHRASIFLG